MQTNARRDGDLNGSKMWISLCDVADHFLIFAKTDKGMEHHGIGCFIVERTFPGVPSKAIKG
jgi:glutaryl-CoA dehydrogenase (non-decarboxylating)